LILIGRRESKLREVKDEISAINPIVQVSLHTADVTDEAAVSRVAETVGIWHAVLHCAGFMNKPTMAAAADLDDYWKAYEVWTPIHIHHLERDTYQQR
jgi:NAD(P)-dependent dehydrogenase (short-subunit alcohol dehydrogenase family)